MSELFVSPVRKPQLMNLIEQLDSEDISKATLGESLGDTSYKESCSLKKKTKKKLWQRQL